MRRGHSVLALLATIATVLACAGLVAACGDGEPSSVLLRRRNPANSDRVES